MADIRINALPTTATSSASDDYIAIDGTANGTRKLSIYSPTLGGNLTVSGGQIQMGGTNPYIQGTTGTGYIQFQNAGDVVLASNSGALAFASGGSTRGYFLSSGNFTLGTSSDTGYKLYVKGSSDTQAMLDVAAGGAYTTQVFANGGSGKGFIYWNNAGSTFEFGTYVAGGAVKFNTGLGTAALTIDSSQNATFAGQVNSGTSTSSGYNNNSNVQLEGLSARLIVNHASGASSGSLYAGFGYNGAGIGSITQSGTTGVLYNTNSDIRLKTNVRDLTNSGAIVDALKPRVFDWKSGDKDYYGFIAQEVFTVFPQAVKQGDSGEEIADQWAMDASKLVPVLVAEIKFLRSRVAALENKA